MPGPGAYLLSGACQGGGDIAIVSMNVLYFEMAGSKFCK